MKTPEQKENEPAMSLFGATMTENEKRTMQKEADRLNENREYRMGGKNTTASERRQRRKARR